MLQHCSFDVATLLFRCRDIAAFAVFAGFLPVFAGFLLFFFKFLQNISLSEDSIILHEIGLLSLKYE